MDRDSQYLSQVRHAQVKEYFFGNERTSLSPHTLNLDLTEVIIWKAAERESQNTQRIRRTW